MRRTAAVIACGIGLGAPVGAAAADGGPAFPMQGGAGATAPGSPVTFVAVGARRDTVVERVRRNGGAVERTAVLRGAFGVPMVGFDGSTTGLSADGRTLVLAALPRAYPPPRTRLEVLDARRLQVRHTIALRGFFTVDAISPNARWLYLIHYGADGNPLRYEVRALDLRTRRLVAKPVVDPREPDEAMRGTAVTRAVSADGRWAYTLYLRPEGPMFVHALDTSGRTAACVDLPVDGRDVDVGTMRLALGDGGAALRLEQRGAPLAVIDTRTFAVRRPAAPPRHAKAVAAASDDAGGGSGWALPAAIALAGGLAALALRALRRRRRRLAV
jgi:hypothetical protein